MNRKDIDSAAYQGKEINSPKISDEVYWLGMYYIYKICKADDIPTEQARKIKAEFVRRIDTLAQWEEIFIDSLNVMTELENMFIVLTKNFTIFLRRNYWSYISLKCIVADIIRIINTISKQIFSLKA